MAELLKVLKPKALAQITEEDYVRQAPDILEASIEPFPRPIDIEPLRAVVLEAMRLFGTNTAASDKWLAPRVHSTLRLYRYEASNQGMWAYLAAAVFRDYVLWRFLRKNGKLDIVRVTGRLTRNAIARLWWTAELTRNGDDYSATAEAFQVQDTALWLIDLDAFHNRAAALGFVGFLAASNNGKRAGSKQIQKYGGALNHALTTIVLDDLVPDTGSDMDAIERWVEELPDETLEPIGPDEPKVPKAQIQAMIELLTRIKDEVDPLGERENETTAAASEEPSYQEAHEVADEEAIIEVEG